MSGVAPRDVVVTNGPFVKLTVDGRRRHRAHGDAADGRAPLAVHVDVTTAAWAAVDTVELFANADVRRAAAEGRDGAGDGALAALCFTARATPPAALRAARSAARGR